MATEDEKYETNDDFVEQSGVRYVSAEPDSDTAVDYTCDRLYAAVTRCNGETYIDETLQNMFDVPDGHFPQNFIVLAFDSEKGIFDEKNKIEVIEFIFNSLFSLLFQQPQFLDSNIERMSLILSRQSPHFSELNIRLLCLLFNLLPQNNQLRAIIMQRLLELGKQSKNYLAKLFKGRLDPLETWIEEDWNKTLNIEQKKQLYQSAYLVAKKAADTEISQTFLINYLKLFDTNDVIKEDVINEASQAVIAAISSKEFNTKIVMELNKSHIVCNVMSKNAKFVKLYELLSIVYEGNVNDLMVFYEKNKEYADGLALDFEALMKKMRLLTLCSLGNIANVNHSFSDLMQKLNLPSTNDVEVLIIEAVTKKLLYAKIDYATNTVAITRAKQRVFNKNSWEELSEKLSLWRKNTNTILGIIHNTSLKTWIQRERMHNL